MTKYYRITYIPSFKGTGVCEYIVKTNSDEEFNQWLLKNCGCTCPDCKVATDWWETASSCEYIIEEIEEPL